MIKFLIEGFKDFKINYYDNDKSYIKNLVKSGQKPKTMVVSCSDSRVDPAILFQTKPGEIFAVRNVANLVPPYAPDKGHHGVSAAIEFGVLDLKIQDIIILGHAHCSGIRELCSNGKEQTNHTSSKNVKREFIDSWMNIAAPIMEKFDLENNLEFMQHDVEKESIKNSIKNLKTFPWVSKLVENQKLNIHGWWFDIENGELFQFDESNDSFIKI